MIQPIELRRELPMQVHNGMSTTTKVWEILSASKIGDLQRVEELVAAEPGLVYAQYNYTPPIHFAVREGHIDLVEYLLLEQGALDPTYRIYPFQESLLTIAKDRNEDMIAGLLQQYLEDPSLHKCGKDNGAIEYNRTQQEKDFEQAVDKEDLQATAQLLKENPALALDETFFWSEGILTMPAKEANYQLMELLMSYGAKVPGVLKWTQFYYFERYDSAVFLMEHGMNPDTMSWHHVTLLHDMAQKGHLDKAALLLKHGAQIDPIDEEYWSTPLGLAAKWGQEEMVDFLLRQGADPNKAGAPWATPLAWATRRGHTAIIALLKQYNAYE
ncbi:MAG: ankyrin repeat domain-containing protein [Niastella sp.]|nr:ankyrin repeat domain-containing protein [Niastella sp.]